MRKSLVIKLLFSILVGFVLNTEVSAQCPRVFDYNGTPTYTPRWYHCIGSPFSFNLQSPNNWGSFVINWGDGTPNSTGTSWTAPSIINHVYAAAVETYTVTITEVATGCVITGEVVMEEATSASIQIPVGGLTQACAPQVMEFINSSTNVSDNTTFTWDFGDGSAPLTFDHTNWQQTISHLYDVGTVDCETVVRLTAENYCNTIQGGESEATFNPIRIWDLDDPGIGASATLLCYPDTTVTFTNITERNCLFQGNIYQRYEYWNFGDYWNLGHDSIIDWTPWPPTFPKTMHYPGIGTYTVQLLDSNFCGIAPTSITIQIVPPPVAGLSANQDTICAGQSVTFTQLSTGGNNYQWNFGVNGNWITTGSGNITYVFNSPGTYTVTTRVGITGATAGCTDEATVQIVVLPRPSVNIIPSPTVGCDEMTVNYTATVSNDVINWNWTFNVAPNVHSGATPPAIFYNTVGTHPVSLTVTNSNGCSRTDNDFITIHPSPAAAISVTNLCEGEIAQFTNAATTAAGQPITSVLWNFGDGFSSADNNPTHLYDIPGTYTVSLVVNTANCSDSTSMDVTIEARPTTNIIQNIDAGCSPVIVSFDQVSTNATQYIWNFGNGETSTEASASATFVNNTLNDSTFVIVLTASNDFGCSIRDTAYVTVYAAAVAAFNDGNTPPGCAPFEIPFQNTSINAGSYFWDLGDGTTTTAFQPSHLYENNTGFIQTFDVTLIAYSVNGCNDTITQQIIVYPQANFDFSITDFSGCSPLNVTMPFVSGVQSYQWNFGNGQTSTLPIPNVTFNNFGTTPIEYTVTLQGTSAFGCVDIATSTITVHPGPIAQFSIDNTAGCSPLTVSFSNVSINGSQFNWDYGNGETSTVVDAIHSKTFINNTNSVVTYDVILTAISADGCSHTFTLPIQVFPSVVAAFTDPGQVCGPITVAMINNSENAQNFAWNFGNSIVANSDFPSVFYGNPGDSAATYTIQLIATSSYGCTDTTSQDIVVYPAPIAFFTIDESAACEPAPIEITNQSQFATSYLWTYGDGSSSAIADSIHSHVYAAPGNNVETFTIQLQAYNSIGCSSSSIVDFTLFPEVRALFSTDTAGCAPHVADFANQSIGATSFTWNFGDGGVSSLPQPTHTYGALNGENSIYPVELIAQNLYGCVDTATVNMYVYANPIADISIDTLFGCYPQSVTFANNSVGATNYEWVYGTGETSNITDSLHTHVFYNFSQETVTYIVRLFATTENGCQSSDQVVVQVSPELEADFTITAQGCSPLTVQFDNNTDGGWTYQWIFGDGETSNQFEPTHTFFNWTDADTTFNVLLVVQNQFGCIDTADAFVSVYPIPQVAFTANPEEQVWPNATVTLGNQSIGGNLNWEWRMGDGTELSVENPEAHTYASWGTFNIRLIGANNFCSDTAYQTVVIMPPAPVVNFEGPAAGCVPLTVQFTNLSEYAASSTWLFGDGGQANATNPVYTYYQPGTYTVTLVINGFDGSTVQMVQEQIIQVYPNAQAAFTVTPNEISIPSQPVYCLNLSNNANSYEWDFGDGNFSNDQNPIHYFTQEGIYSITLIANNEYNCPDTMQLVDAVYAKKGGLIDFPNAFTPDPNGGAGGAYNPNSFDNDVFFPIHSGVIEYQLLIFNKWGELLYESTDVNRGWDGFYRGQLCKQDVYVWKVNARFVDGQRFEKAGDVTLLVK
jgi:PKD repeat protein